MKKIAMLFSLIFVALFAQNADSMTTEQYAIWSMVKNHAENMAILALYGEQQLIVVDIGQQSIDMSGTIVLPPGGLALALADSIKKIFPKNMTLEECKKMCQAANRGQMRALAQDTQGIDIPWIDDKDLALWRQVMKIAGREKYPAKQ